MPNRFENRGPALAEIAAELHADLTLVVRCNAESTAADYLDDVLAEIIDRLAAHGMSDINIRAALKLRPAEFKSLTPKG